MVNVSWDDAVAYCQWLSIKSQKQYRLPSEAQWEKAARGEDGRIYPYGNNFDPKNANTLETYPGDISAVGYFSPQGDSPYGCSDMAGNIWEWCNDWFNENEYKQRQGLVVKDPKGPQAGISRVLRGGAFDHSYGFSRCALRYGLFPNIIADSLGFRVALSPVKSENSE